MTGIVALLCCSIAAPVKPQGDTPAIQRGQTKKADENHNIEFDKLLEVRLEPRVPTDKQRLRWSPKGAKIQLHEVNGALQGKLHLGPKVDEVQPDPWTLVLEQTPGAKHFDQLWIDLNRDGKRSAPEVLSTQPSEQRGKFWSSFEAVVPIPLPHERGTRPYPLSLWFVADPSEPDQAPVLRWSRRGWHEGTTEVDGRKVFVLITESKLDGVFDFEDAWFLSFDGERLVAEAGSRPLARHAWLGEQAYSVSGMTPDGLALIIQPFDPGITRAEEERAEDLYAADRNAARAAKPLAFSHDFEKAEAKAKAAKAPLLVDFETTWCGPCKQIDRFVYTAETVVNSAKKRGLVAVKVDGDLRKDLTQRFGVTAFPTLILLAPDGTVLKRQVGYMGVKATAEFFQAK